MELKDEIHSNGKVARVPVKFLSLEATIGAGKSTQLEKLKEVLAERDDVVFLNEPVDEWEKHGLLSDFYNGRIGNGTFQLMVLMSLAGPLISAVQKRPKLIVAERSPHSNYHTFALANLVKSDLTAYKYTYEELLKAIPVGEMETHMLYLKVAPETALERIKKRNRNAEDAVSIDYLRTLDRLHEDMVANEVADFSTTVDAAMTESDVHERIMCYVNGLLCTGDCFTSATLHFRDCEHKPL